MKILYLDCFSGISGDMTVAALADAGADRNYIEEELKRIKLEPFTLEWNRVIKRGISSLKFDVIPDPGHPPQHHRHYSDIVQMIEQAGFQERVTAISLAIFEKIAAAEGKIHGIPVDKVHFHEVGAIDSIVDILGIALAIESLGVEKIMSSPIPLGSGHIHIDHGTYPVPAPATLEMMRGLPIAASDIRMELTTPTGAGVIAAMVDEFSLGIPPMTVESIGYGAGTRDMQNQPNVLRAVVGTIQDASHHQHSHSHKHVSGDEHGHSHDHAHDHPHK
jgi:uncharacterized protein (TIGR00299 family) protein